MNAKQDPDKKIFDQKAREKLIEEAEARYLEDLRNNESNDEGFKVPPKITYDLLEENDTGAT